MIKKIAFTLYPVTDQARARAFYEETLGLSAGASGGQDDKFWLEYDLPGGGCLALSNATPNQPSAEAGGTIAFEVDDLDATIARLRERDVPLLGDVIHGPNCRMIPCLDPDGNSIVMHQVNPAAD